MSKPAETLARGARRRAWIALAGCAPLLCAAAIPVAGPVPASPPAAAASAAAPSAPLQGRFRLRCWQHGRLLFEQGGIGLPAGGPSHGVRLAGTDGAGRPLYLADTEHATCLLQQEAAAGSKVRP